MVFIIHMQVADGVNAIELGPRHGGVEQLAYVGGNCSITGFDCNGQDQFWTVRTLCVCVCVGGYV